MENNMIRKREMNRKRESCIMKENMMWKRERKTNMKAMRVGRENTEYK